MDDWDIPDEEDYETQYADELEMLDELDNDGPPARKSLKFHGNGTEDNTSSVNSNNYNNNGLEDLTKSKKRDHDEMFSTLVDGVQEDVDEIEWLTSSDSGPRKKKARIVPVRNGELDSLESQLAQPLKAVSNNKKWNSPSSGKLEKNKVFQRLPMSCDSVSVTRMDGQRLYLSLKADADAGDKRSRCSMIRKGPGNSLQLLSIPFSLLRDHVEEERRRRTIEESERLTESLHRMLNDGSNPEEVEAQKPDISEDEPKVPQSALWVEKYSPRLFTELLSDDAINRTLLKWLKLWDQVVFNRGKNKKVRKKPDQHNKHKQTHNKKQGIQDATDWDELDATGRPARKVALLCGPPGLGKTTLAHVIARHAGYNVVEMNASDDRSSEVFKNTLEASTQMKSVLGYDEKPNCLIIDEIDGAPAPAINVLLTAIKQKDSDAAPSKKSKKGKKIGPLSRPIICICNDQYAPALRQLRQVAFLVTFPPTVPSRLASRLLEIARQELVNTDMTTLSLLCEKTDNDIRSCLNTLQFIHKRHGRVWLEHVQSLDIGQKDAHRSLFSIWQEIFQLPKPKRHRFAAVANSGREVGIADNNKGRPSIGALGGNLTSGEHRGISVASSRFHSVLHSAMSSGQYDKVSQGIFENYLQVKFKDASFEVVVSGTEWLTFSDFIDRAVNERQSYILLGYSPFLSVAFHLLFASSSHSKLSYPSSQYESYLKETKTRNLVNTIKNESSPRIRQNVGVRTACLELFPFILEVITPTLRPVNTQLFSTREKQQLVELIDSMIAYNLTYHQERNLDGQYAYMLDPNIEEAVKFPGLPQHKQLTYANKQLIAREIELEKMRRAERALISQSDNDGKQEENKPKKAVVVLSLDTKKTTPKDSKPALDFFGRPLKAKPKPPDCQADHLSESKPSIIWFRFNEGYSNAVRKSVKVQEFL